MKTIEEILNPYFDTSEESQDVVCYYPHLIEAMKAYAEQEVRKHLEIAAEEVEEGYSVRETKRRIKTIPITLT